MFKKKKSPKESPKTQSPNSKLIEAYQSGVSIQDIAAEHDMTTEEVYAVVVNE